MPHLPRLPAQEGLPTPPLRPLMLDILAKVRPDNIVFVIYIEFPEQEESGPRRILDVEDAQDVFTCCVRFAVDLSEFIEIEDFPGSDFAQVGFFLVCLSHEAKYIH